MNRFDGKTVVVTGAGGGIGSAMAARFAHEGAHAIVCDANAELAAATLESIVAAGHAARVAVFDVSDPDQVREFAHDTIATHGRIDVLINNAGIIRRGALLDLAVEDWHDTMRVNLDSMYYMCRAFLPHMVETGGGAIVNTGSQWGLSPAPGHIAYNVSKAALHHLTRQLAHELAPGVRVNAIAAAVVRTRLSEALWASDPEGAARAHPLGRLGDPDDVARAAVFLLSDAAAWITGVVLPVDGGLTGAGAALG